MIHAIPEKLNTHQIRTVALDKPAARAHCADWTLARQTMLAATHAALPQRTPVDFNDQKRARLTLIRDLLDCLPDTSAKASLLDLPALHHHAHKRAMASLRHSRRMTKATKTDIQAVLRRRRIGLTDRPCSIKNNPRLSDASRTGRPSSLTSPRFCRNRRPL